jgi:hypothetical protein
VNLSAGNEATEKSKEIRAMTIYKYQTGFANELAAKWEAGNHSEVRNVIRGLKNKAQAAYIATFVGLMLGQEEGFKFLEYMHPNNQ